MWCLFFFCYELTVLITVQQDHSIEQPTSYTNIWLNELNVFYQSGLLFCICIYLTSKSHTLVRPINIGVFLTNPFQLHFYCSDSIASSNIASYHSNLRYNCFRVFDSTITCHEHTLKASLIPWACQNSPWYSECTIIWMMSWEDGIWPQHSASCRW